MTSLVETRKTEADKKNLEEAMCDIKMTKIVNRELTFASEVGEHGRTLTPARELISHQGKLGPGIDQRVTRHAAAHQTRGCEQESARDKLKGNAGRRRGYRTLIQDLVGIPKC